MDSNSQLTDYLSARLQPIVVRLGLNIVAHDWIRMNEVEWTSRLDRDTDLWLIEISDQWFTRAEASKAARSGSSARPHLCWTNLRHSLKWLDESFIDYDSTTWHGTEEAKRFHFGGIVEESRKVYGQCQWSGQSRLKETMKRTQNKQGTTERANRAVGLKVADELNQLEWTDAIPSSSSLLSLQPPTASSLDASLLFPLFLFLHRWLYIAYMAQLCGSLLGPSACRLSLLPSTPHCRSHRDKSFLLFYDKKYIIRCLIQSIRCGLELDAKRFFW